MATDIELIKGLLQDKFAQAAGSNDDAKTAIKTLFSNEKSYTKSSADSMASSTTSETRMGIYVPWAANLTVYYLPTGAGLTASDTDYATITVSKRDSAGANKTTVGTLTTTTTSSGSLTQDVAKAFVMASGSVNVAAGSTLTYEIAKTGSGVVVPVGTIVVLIEKV